MPCSADLGFCQKRARLLLNRGRARIHNMLPFTIRMVDRLVEDSQVQPLEIKLDPGSKTTGLAVVRVSVDVDAQTGEIQKRVHVLNLLDLIHRSTQISEALKARRGHRRLRRGQLRYRAPRFDNRGNKGTGWLSPNLQHQVDTSVEWVKRLENLAPISAMSTELVRFDIQAIESPEIEGAQYQQETLAGYEVREYLLEKWHRTCAYCDAKDVPLQIEPIQPKAKGGSNRISNLALACPSCNAKKAALPIEVFLSKQPERLKRIQVQAKLPLKDAAAVSSIRWALVNALKATGLPVETVSGGQTKFNSNQLGIPKTHALDAVCVGNIDAVTDWQKPTLSIKAMGQGSYQRTRLDKFGCVRGYLTRAKSIQSFQTGDIVKAIVLKEKKIATYVGRVAVRASGSFNIQTGNGLVQGVHNRYCAIVQRGDGYGYSRVAKMDATGTPPKPMDASHLRSTSPTRKAGVSCTFG